MKKTNCKYEIKAPDIGWVDNGQNMTMSKCETSY